MSKFGMKQNPNNKLAGKLKRDRTIDLNRMYRQSQKKQKINRQPKQYNHKKIQIDDTTLGWIIIMFGLIGLIRLILK